MNDVSRRVRLIVACALLLGAARSALAQSASATLVGTVRDATSAVIASARVSATSRDTAGVRTTDTDRTGAYTLAQLPPGEYGLIVEAPGFSPFVAPSVALEVGNVSRLDLRLEVGPVASARAKGRAVRRTSRSRRCRRRGVASREAALTPPAPSSDAAPAGSAVSFG